MVSNQIGPLCSEALHEQCPHSMGGGRTILRPREPGVAKKVRELPTRRRTRSLATWAPERAATEGGDATGDPDPPLTA